MFTIYRFEVWTHDDRFRQPVRSRCCILCKSDCQYTEYKPHGYCCKLLINMWSVKVRIRTKCFEIIVFGENMWYNLNYDALLTFNLQAACLLRPHNIKYFLDLEQRSETSTVELTFHCTRSEQGPVLKHSQWHEDLVSCTVPATVPVQVLTKAPLCVNESHYSPLQVWSVSS